MATRTFDADAGRTSVAMGAASRRHSWRARTTRLLGLPLLLLALIGSHAAQAANLAAPDAARAANPSEESRMWMTVG